MLQRPKATDTEEDLLTFQESFLASGHRPAASVVSSAHTQGHAAGRKRPQGELDLETRKGRERDVVQLQLPGRDLASMEDSKPPTKKSKFKERREAKYREGEFEDPYEEMGQQDRHITKILAEIQEHDTFTSPPVAMPTSLTKRGFPTVHEIDFQRVPKVASRGGNKGKKKSLFAQQFESHGAEYFGIELQPPGVSSVTASVHTHRDRVEPVNLGGSFLLTGAGPQFSGEGGTDTRKALRTERKHVRFSDEVTTCKEDGLTVEERDDAAAEKYENLDRTSEDNSCLTIEGTSLGHSTSKLPRAKHYHSTEPGGDTPQSSIDSSELPQTENTGSRDPLPNAQFASEASHAWEQLLQSGLVTGEGLVSVGVSREGAREEVTKIHDENVERLSTLSEGEILEEQERIKQVLGPELVSFLRMRKQWQATKEGDQRPRPELLSAQEASEGGSEGGSVGGSVGGKEEEELPEPMEGSGEEVKGEGPGGWLHMGVVEREKMEWMIDVPLQHSQGLQEVRFSLEGLVVPRQTSIPTHLGLHHHGDEPEAAGYTLSELLHLSRSTVLQQRVLSLQTMARIIQRASQNEYAGLVAVSMLDSLLEAGLPILLRYALDDNADTVMAAAIQCIHELLVVPVGEYVLAEYWNCLHGASLPALRSHDQSRDKAWNEVEEEKETDAEIMQRDVIEGFLCMNLLPRLRYILEVCRPPLSSVSASLEILTRICRHSLQAASQVVNCPRLMNVIFKEFLPLTWNEDQDPTQAHGRPQPAAMALVQATCAAGRNLAANLTSHHRLLEVVMRFAVLHPTELSLPLEEAYGMGIASLRVWRVLLTYGLGTEAFRDTYPALLKQLQLMASSKLFALGHNETQRAAVLVVLAEAAIHVAAVTPDMLKMEGETGELPTPAVSWGHASGMLTPLLNALSAWVEESGSGRQQLDRIPCVSSVLHFVASYFTKVLSKLPAEGPLGVLHQVESLATGVMDKFAHSSLFTIALQALRTTSKLANIQPLDTKCPPPQPPSLSSHLSLPLPPKPALYQHPTMEFSDFQELVRPQVVCFTAANLLLGYGRLCLAATVLHKGIIGKVTAILSNETFQEYLEAVVRNPVVKYSCFEFAELHFIYCTVKLFIMLLELSEDGSIEEGLLQLFHHAAFKLLSLLPTGMECFVHDLVSTTVLHPKLLFELSGPTSLVTKDIGGLTLREQPQPITSAAADDSSMQTPSAMLAEAFKRLGSIRDIYVRAIEDVCGKQKLKMSRSLLLQYPLATASLLLPSYTGPVLPIDWVLWPIMREYNTLQSTGTSEEPSSEVVSVVTHSLYLLLLLEYLRPRVLSELPPSAKLARLMCTFLIGSDMFFEKEVKRCLSALLRLYCREEVQRNLQFDVPVMGLASFHDLYLSLLSQFAAVSYGDPLFACFILLPLQQRFSVQLRRALWDDHPSVLRVLSLPITQLPVAIENYLHPDETDGLLLELYMKALATAAVRPLWSPVLYLTTVHHLHSFLFRDSENSGSVRTLQKKLAHGVQQLKNNEVRRHLLLYQGPDMECSLGFGMASGLTEQQKMWLTTLGGD